MKKFGFPIPPVVTNIVNTNLSNFQGFLEVCKKFKVEIERRIEKELGVRSENLENQKEFVGLISAIEEDLKLIKQKEAPRHYREFYEIVPERTTFQEEEIKKNPKLLNNIQDTGRIEGKGMSIGIIRVQNQEEKKFTLTQCPQCGQPDLRSKKSFKSHIRTSHIGSSPFIIKRKQHKRYQSSLLKLKISHQQIRNLGNLLNPHQIQQQINKIFHQKILPDNKKTLFLTILNQIKNILKQNFPQSDLKIYGSVMNGFATFNSDIDLCLVLDLKKYAFEYNSQASYQSLLKHFNKRKAQNLAQSLILLKAARTLQQRGALQIQAKLKPRVKILNFKLPSQTPIQIDLSLNNLLGIQNTNLLFAYSQIDPRVPKLGLIIKLWAKANSIANPKNSTLASYTYIILLIYFLQRTEPPILPYLQILSTKKKIVQSQQCSFDPDFHKYQFQASQNHYTTADLLYQFFKFYAFFNWDENMVDIKYPQTQRKPAPQSNEKNYKFFIQDPFQSSRNLGDVVSWQNAITITHHFRKALVELYNQNSLFPLLRLTT